MYVLKLSGGGKSKVIAIALVYTLEFKFWNVPLILYCLHL